METKTIAIIGGGLTGMTAAYRLAKAGYKVTIFEKFGELGGLAAGFQIQGNYLEKTYHHIFRTDTDILNFVKELGIEDKLMWLKSVPANCYEGKIYSFGSPKTLLLFKPFSFINRIRTGVVSLYLQKTNQWKPFVPMTAYSWVQKWYGAKVTKIFWEPLLKGKFDKYYDKVSMAWLWARIHTRLQSRVKGVSEEVLGYFDGGFNVIIKKLHEELLRLGVEIRTGVDIQSVSSFELQASQDKKLEITAQQLKPCVTVNNEELFFDKILMTVPSHIAAKLITPQNTEIKDAKLSTYLSKLNSIDYLGAVVAVFSSDQKLGTHYWHSINDLSFPFLVFVNHTNFVDKSKYNNKYIYYIGAYVPHDHVYFSQSDEDIYKLWFDGVKRLFPEFDETQVVDKFLFKLKNAQHIVDTEYESKIPEYETPIPNVYLSNFSQIFPEDRGTNFAVREGNSIAQLMTND